MNAFTQTLPSTADGKIYIFLGIAYSATAMELRAEHPVYWHDGTALRIWNGAAGASITVDSALSSTSENPVQNKVINTALSGKVDKTYTSGTITNTIESNEYGIYGLTSDSSANTSGSVGTSAIGAYLTASDANGFYTLEATTTGFGATYIDGTTFETETIFDFTAMTEQEIASAVNAGWVVEITFYVQASFGGSTSTWYAEEGMTWAEFCNSSYGTGWSIDVEGIHPPNSVMRIRDQVSTDVIINGATYGLTGAGN
jgi:hypothetical protein